MHVTNLTPGSECYPSAAVAYGGAIYTVTSTSSSLNYAWPVQLDGAALTKNTASDGGAVYAPSVSVSVVNSKVNYNVANRRGGGFYSESGNNLRKGIGCLGSKQVVKMLRSEVKYNYAVQQGGGIFLWNAAVESTLLSTVAFNHAGDGGGVSLVGMYSGFSNTDGGSILANVYENMASTSPDVSYRYNVGAWYDVCKTSNRYTKAVYSNFTSSTINYCPTGACYSPHESSVGLSLTPRGVSDWLMDIPAVTNWC
jgi:hypothetical protein